MTKGLFVTATGTEAGKTYICSLILKKLVKGGEKATYYKGALSGAIEADGKLIPGDSAEVLAAADIETDPCLHVSYVYRTEASPHLAAEIEGNPPFLSKMLRDYERICSSADYIVVEGSGGIICPLRSEKDCLLMLTDLIKAFGLKILIVSPAGLGAINSALLTISYAKSMDIDIAGIILNRYDPGNPVHENNRKMIEQLSGICVKAAVRENDSEIDISHEKLKLLFD